MRALPTSRRSPILAALCAALLPAAATAQRPTSIRCGHVLAPDGSSWLADHVVVLLGHMIVAVQPAKADEPVDEHWGDSYLLPGLIDLHTHLCLRPYNEAAWDQQVLAESLELRSIRAAAHATTTWQAGFVAVRDLGTEGAGFADVALRQAVGDGVLHGPTIFATTKAIVATGCYGPNLPTVATPKGAQVADGAEGVRIAVREQVAAGADWIKVYADYRRAPGKPATPTFTREELAALCAEAKTAGVRVAAHAMTDEGIRNAVLAGVATIEHGSGASEETLKLMAERGVVLCPCLAANEAIVRYAGHTGPVVDRLNIARIGFQRALAAGVTIACGSDAGVFAHGDNARELELMVDHGMTPVQALAAATTVAAKVLGGRFSHRIEKDAATFGLLVVDGDPLADIRNLRRVRAVIADDRRFDERRRQAIRR